MVQVQCDNGFDDYYSVGFKGFYELCIADDENANVLRKPRIGARVKSGPAWFSGDVDGNGLGTTVDKDSDGDMVWVKWDNGSYDWHCVEHGWHELCIVEDEKAAQKFDIRQEVKFMQSLEHPTIGRLHEVSGSSDNVCNADRLFCADCHVARQGTKSATLRCNPSALAS